MTVQVLKGSKQEIVERVTRLSGEIREAIVFIEEPSGTIPNEDIFTEMDTFTVRVGNADYSRESLYSRVEGE
jgi:hypothetical protein